MSIPEVDKKFIPLMVLVIHLHPSKTLKNKYLLNLNIYILNGQLFEYNLHLIKKINSKKKLW